MAIIGGGMAYAEARTVYVQALVGEDDFTPKHMLFTTQCTGQLKAPRELERKTPAAPRLSIESECH